MFICRVSSGITIGIVLQAREKQKVYQRGELFYFYLKSDVYELCSQADCRNNRGKMAFSENFRR